MFKHECFILHLIMKSRSALYDVVYHDHSRHRSRVINTVAVTVQNGSVYGCANSIGHFIVKLFCDFLSLKIKQKKRN